MFEKERHRGQKHRQRVAKVCAWLSSFGEQSRTTSEVENSLSPSFGVLQTVADPKPGGLKVAVQPRLPSFC